MHLSIQTYFYAASTFFACLGSVNALCAVGARSFQQILTSLDPAQSQQLLIGFKGFDPKDTEHLYQHYDEAIHTIDALAAWRKLDAETLQALNCSSDSHAPIDLAGRPYSTEGIFCVQALEYFRRMKMFDESVAQLNQHCCTDGDVDIARNFDPSELKAEDFIPKDFIRPDYQFRGECFGLDESHPLAMSLKARLKIYLELNRYPSGGDKNISTDFSAFFSGLVYHESLYADGLYQADMKAAYSNSTARFLHYSHFGNDMLGCKLQFGNGLESGGNVYVLWRDGVEKSSIYLVKSY